MASPVTDPLGSDAQAGQWVGCCVRSTTGKWLRRTPLTAPALSAGNVLELDGLWMRAHAGGAELKVIRDADTGVALVAFERRAEMIDRAWQSGAP